MCKMEYPLTMDEQKKYGDALRKLVDPYVSPISYFFKDDTTGGYHLGTGSFIEHEGNRFLITNHHVAYPKDLGIDLSTISLAFHFNGEGNYVRQNGPFASRNFPVDVACMAIAENVWEAYHDEACCISPEQFDTHFNAVDKEFFFLEGFPGQRARMFSDTLATKVTPLLTFQRPLVKSYDPNMHFALFYDIDNYRCSGDQDFLAGPSGMSGSLVWNTKIQECRQNGVEWTPDMPKVVGIVHHYCSDDKCLVATKVECMQRDILAKEALDAKEEMQA